MNQPSSQQSPQQDPYIVPISAAILAEAEISRRNRIRDLGPCRVGCSEIDDYILVNGGLERGCVVGMSAEDDEGFGVMIGLQTLVHSLVRGNVKNVMVITPRLKSTMMLKTLRDVTRAQMVHAQRERDLSEPSSGSNDRDIDGKVRACLDKVTLSPVFDLDGVWEVLAELDRPEETSPPPPPGGSARSPQKANPPAEPQQEEKTQEIEDSQDEDGDSQPPPTPFPPRQSPSPPKPQRTLPEIILISHFSSLLTRLFTQRDKSSAHTHLHLLSSHLRHLCRSLSSQPLVLILNSTASSPSSSSNTSKASPAGKSTTRPAPPPGRSGSGVNQKVPDPTLRSIFNPPPLPLPGYAYGSAIKRNKPSFGLVFTQLLDVHLLCTRLPRDKESADAVHDTAEPRRFAQRSPEDGQGRGTGGDGHLPRFVTVVEVLLDEVGVWEGKRGNRQNREQRWAPVDVVDGRIVNAFPEAPKPPQQQNPQETYKLHQEVRLSAGFGGRRH